MAFGITLLLLFYHSVGSFYSTITLAHLTSKNASRAWSLHKSIRARERAIARFKTWRARLRHNDGRPDDDDVTSRVGRGLRHEPYFVRIGPVCDGRGFQPSLSVVRNAPCPCVTTRAHRKVMFRFQLEMPRCGRPKFEYRCTVVMDIAPTERVFMRWIITFASWREKSKTLGRPADRPRADRPRDRPPTDRDPRAADKRLDRRAAAAAAATTSVVRSRWPTKPKRRAGNAAPPPSLSSSSQRWHWQPTAPAALSVWLFVWDGACRGKGMFMINEYCGRIFKINNESYEFSIIGRG